MNAARQPLPIIAVMPTDAILHMLKQHSIAQMIPISLNVISKGTEERSRFQVQGYDESISAYNIKEIVAETSTTHHFIIPTAERSDFMFFL
jgi:hypothetical protein